MRLHGPLTSRVCALEKRFAIGEYCMIPATSDCLQCVTKIFCDVKRTIGTLLKTSARQSIISTCLAAAFLHKIDVFAAE